VTDAPETLPRRFPRPTGVERLLLLAILAAVVALSALLSVVPPDPRGLGTHERLPFGMARCSWPVTVGLPCPTCGVTTAACHLVHGQVLRAFAVQPFGATLMAAALAAAAATLWHLARNRSLFWRISLWPWGRVLVAGVLLGLLSWGYKVLVFLAAKSS
jgi:hypothetical protein